MTNTSVILLALLLLTGCVVVWTPREVIVSDPSITTSVLRPPPSGPRTSDLGPLPPDSPLSPVHP